MSLFQSNQSTVIFDTPTTLVENTTTNQKFKPGPLFDVEKGDFVLDSAGRVLIGTPYDAWVLWCVKTISTQRFAHMAYSSDIGIEEQEAFAQKGQSAVQSYFERTITEALMADPIGRTRYVRNFVFDWKADALNVTCTVYSVDGNTATISRNLNHEGG